METKKSFKTILISGLVDGNLDAVAGVIVYYIWFGFNPFQVLQYIASGVHGPSAINSGALMVIAGLIYHFIIAFTVAAIYFYAYPKISLLRDYKVIAGLAFGVGIWLLMNLIVLPNSNIPKGPFDLGLAIVGILWHAVLVGLPTDKYYSK